MKKIKLIALIVIANITFANAQNYGKAELDPYDAEELFEEFEKTVRLTLSEFEAERASGRELIVKEEGGKLIKSYSISILHRKVIVNETYKETTYPNGEYRFDIEVTFEIVNLTPDNIRNFESHLRAALYYAGYKRTEGNGSYSGWENYTYKVGMNRSISSLIIWIEKLDHNN